MRLRAVASCGLWQLLAAFQAPLRPAAVAPRCGELNMGAPDVVAKKAAIVGEVREAMEASMLMFSVRSEGITVNDMNMMRQKFSDEVTVRCVKNTLIRRAAQEVPRFQGGDELLKYSNYWFFVPEAHLRSTVETWNEWVEETKNVRRRTGAGACALRSLTAPPDRQEDNAIVGGVFEGECLDPKGVVAITKLPTKQELMQKTAVLLKALPSKLARSVDQAGAQRLARVTKEASASKLARAVKGMADSETR